MIGVPQEDRHKLFEWSNRMIGSEDPEYTRQRRRGAERADRDVHVRERARGRSARENPRDDIVTALLEAEVDGDTLTEMDFNLFFLLLAVAGNETTRNSISHGVRAFCDYPEQYQLLVEDPSLRSSAAEEVVRWASPVMYFRRNVTKDTEIRGQEIKAGDKVSIWYISANRDEDVFDDPFTFDITRDPERARRLRWRWSAPLPRLEPRPDGDLRAARGDGAPHADARARSATRRRCAPTSSPGSSTCR